MAVAFILGPDSSSFRPPKAAIDGLFGLLPKDLLQKTTMERQNAIVVKSAGSGIRCLGLDPGSLNYSLGKLR